MLHMKYFCCEKVKIKQLCFGYCSEQEMYLCNFVDYS